MDSTFGGCRGAVAVDLGLGSGGSAEQGGAGTPSGLVAVAYVGLD